MKCAVVALVFVTLAAASLALPVVQQQQAANPQFPALQEVLVEATSEVEAIRKARQILDVNVGLYNGGMCDKVTVEAVIM